MRSDVCSTTVLEPRYDKERTLYKVVTRRDGSLTRLVYIFARPEQSTFEIVDYDTVREGECDPDPLDLLPVPSGVVLAMHDDWVDDSEGIRIDVSQECPGVESREVAVAAMNVRQRHDLEQ